MTIYNVEEIEARIPKICLQCAQVFLIVNANKIHSATAARVILAWHMTSLRKYSNERPLYHTELFEPCSTGLSPVIALHQYVFPFGLQYSF